MFDLITMTPSIALKRLTLGALVVLSGEKVLFAQAPTHAYINTMRSSDVTHYFVNVGAFGLNGKYNVGSGQSGDAEDRNTVDSQSGLPLSSTWQGYGVRNELGIEFLKFLQFSVAHVSISSRSNKNSSVGMHGSRMEGSALMNFYSPLGNLLFGGGVVASRLDYRQEAANGSYYGAGYFYRVGYDYFLSSIISFNLDLRQTNEKLNRNNGPETIPAQYGSETMEAGAGFRLWF